MKKIMLITIILMLIITGCTITPPSSIIDDSDNRTAVIKTTDNVSVDATVEPENMITIRTGDLEERTGVDFDVGYLLEIGSWDNFLYTKYDITVLTSKTSYDEYIVNLKTSLMAEDSSFDIYTFNTTLADILTIIRKDYFVDLQTSDKLSAQFPLMYREIRQMISYDGKVFGFPLMSRNDPITIAWTKDLVNKYGINTLPCTLEDLLSLNDTLGNNSGNIMLPAFSFNNKIKMDLLSNQFDPAKYHIDFEKVDIQRAKTNYKVLRDSNLLYDTQNYFNNSSYKLENAIGSKYLYQVKQNLELYDFENIYLSDDDSNRYIGFNFLMINPYSDNIDLALEFIADIAILQKTGKDQLFLEKGEKAQESYVFTIPLYPLYKDAQTYIDNEFSLYPPWDYTQEYLDMHGDSIKDLTLFTRFNGYDECMEIIQSYFDDEIEEEMAKQQMQRIMDLVSREYTLD